MTDYVIVVKHAHQDPHYPHEQTVNMTGSVGYSVRYALFMALIETGKDFTIRIKGGDEDP